MFEEELGELCGVTAKIHVNPNSQPQFEKAQPVPFALRHKVKQELDRLQGLGIIKPIQFSDWAASDWRVRICGYYKVTINRASKLEKYSMYCGIVCVIVRKPAFHETGPLAKFASLHKYHVVSQPSIPAGVYWNIPVSHLVLHRHPQSSRESWKIFSGYS